jgi:FAD-dependent urate hydroxylase
MRLASVVRCHDLVSDFEYMMKKTVAIIGAGPYGLSMAAHLRDFANLSVRVFGRTMSFWQDYMPEGMFLRSGWRASYIADPSHSLTLEAYQSATGERVANPVPLGDFVAYGSWFQRQSVPELDRRLVTKIISRSREFLLALEDGETLRADRIIIATGIAPFAYTPRAFAGLPKCLASHASEHKSLRRFAGKKVAVVGGGQSALESAALLAEIGAKVHVYVRKPMVHFLSWRKRIMNFRPLFKMLYSWTDVGPAGLSQLVSHPQYFRALPRSLQDPIARRCIRPAGASWLRARLGEVQLHVGKTVRSATQIDSRLNLQISDSSKAEFDHLLFGTGYKIDVSKYHFLSTEILSAVRQSSGYPVLNGDFQSSVPGLYFLGAPAAWSFGPLMRFVAGTEFGCARLAASLSGH